MLRFLNISTVVLLWCMLWTTPSPVSADFQTNQAPECSSAHASPASLWPPNHTFTDIAINGVTDPDGDQLNLAVQCIYQDESVNKTGDGNFIWDGAGINSAVPSVRAERSGNNNGRYYHIDYIATDVHGARCGGEVLVAVDKSASQPAVDEGRLFQSVPSENECGLHNINNPPYIYSEPITKARCGLYTYQVLANDPDRDQLVYSLVDAPSGMEIDESEGLVSWGGPIPGTYQIKIKVNDQRGGEDEQIYTLSVESSSFEIISTVDSAVYADQLFQYQPEINVEAPAGSLNYQLDNSPSGMAVNPETGIITWEPAQDYSQVGPEADPYCTGVLDDDSPDETKGSADVVVVVDESGSMSGEHAWVKNFVQSLEQGLLGQEIGVFDANYYGLIGFEYTPREIFMADQEKMGSAGQFVEAAKQLKLYGGTEDGWRALQHAMSKYPFREASAKNILLVTDEDRDSSNVQVSYESVKEQIEEGGFLLNAVVNAWFKCGDGRDALGVDWTGNGYVADGAGGYEICTDVTSYNAYGTTVSDYVNLALETRGAAWNLNYLRLGGHWAQSFSRALIEIKVKEITSQLVRPEVDLAVSTIEVNKAGDLISADIFNRGTGEIVQEVKVSFYGRNRNDGASVLLGTTVIAPDVLAQGRQTAGVPVSHDLKEIDQLTVLAETEEELAECCYENNTAVVPLIGLGIENLCGFDDYQFFTVNVYEVNVSPVITSTPPKKAVVNWPFKYRVEVEDHNSCDGLRFVLQNAPDGMHIGKYSGDIYWLPSQEQQGLNQFLIQVEDSAGLIEEQTIELPVVVNNPPVVMSEPVTEVEINNLYTYQIDAWDEDGDELSYGLAKSPQGMTVDGATGLVSWTPSSNQYGSYDVSILIKDQYGAKIYHDWSISVCRQPSSLSGYADYAFVGRGYSQTLIVYSYGQQSLNYEVLSQPEGMTFTSSHSGIYNYFYIKWTPGEDQLGIQQVIIRFEDECGEVTRNLTIRTMLPPEVELKASSENIFTGEVVTLSWQLKNVEGGQYNYGYLFPWWSYYSNYVLIYPGQVKSKRLYATTTFTVWFYGPYGTLSDSVTVTVKPPPPTVQLTVDHPEIIIGDSATLSWQTTNAQSVVIEPSIGQVANNGSVTLSPSETTTYTLTATGLGGTASVKETIIVVYPEPTVNFSLDRSEIIVGESANLSWETNYAKSVTIEPDLGNVPPSGSVTLSPAETITYTLTASSPGGTTIASQTLTVLYPEPTVQLALDRSEILIGESANLSWSTEYAENVSIDPDLGSVILNGERTVSPNETTTYTLTATGRGGEVSAQVTLVVTEDNPVSLTIFTPLANASLDRCRVLVTGSVGNALDLETGVSVNGRVAHVYGGEFAASHVQLRSGENTLSVVATDSAGNQLVRNMPVSVSSCNEMLYLDADLESMLAPLNTTLNVEVSVKDASDPAYFFTGPGAVDMTGTENPNRVVMGITEPGIYVFSAEVTDGNGNVHTDDVAILANDRSKMDALYHDKWNGMKTAMITGDIEKAVSYFTDSQKNIFREIYTIIEPEMAQLAMDMQDIELIYQKNRVAEYRLRRDVIFKDEPVTVSFYVYFQQGGDGIWRIRDY